ncbi:MAG: tetratricopeptide repeat-containing serine protease family protein [Gloeomargarita sp. SKYG116]|nr:tetratricopeptide repeat-containing serine protease family protein [Gloeomargarita sp. SKYG116]MCS7226298.1 tetratricopeptide repeat-containing serine protease family protein [Gloeomargarita sp. SKYB31]MDW8401312.1 tetratricopeptide repeat-containing serine protease family protein [Gloeomargarita sp. SKYGB_i_bin116]
MKSAAVVLGFLFSTVVVLGQKPLDSADPATAVSKVAKGITVLIDGVNPGSGVLVGREGNTYTVLTAAHVVPVQDEYDIVTPDGQRHPLKYSTVQKLAGVDMATAKFTSDKTYPVAMLGDASRLVEGSPVYVAGFPQRGPAITEPVYNFTVGRVTANASRPLADGYGLVYSNPTLPGMSGGPVLDGQAKLVGVHGRADGGQLERQAEMVYVKTGFNLGIPINTYLSLAPRPAVVAGTPVKPNPAPVRVAMNPNPSRADDFYLLASERYRQGDIAGALNQLTQAVRANPNYAAAYATRGVMRYIQRDQQGAIQDFDQAIRLDPNYPEPYVGRGLARSALGDKTGAIADYTRALELRPTYAEAFYNRGVLLYNQRRVPEALEDLRKAAELYLQQGNAVEYQRTQETLRVATSQCRQQIRTLCDW